VADGQDTPSARRGRRPSAPHLDGPLGSSGAAPGDEPAATGGVDEPAAKTTTGGGKAVPTADAPAVTAPEKAVTASEKAVTASEKTVTTPDKTGSAAAAGDGKGEDESRPDKTGHDTNGLGETASVKAGQEKDEQDKNASDDTGQDKTTLEKADQAKAGPDKTTPEKDGEAKAGQDKNASEKDGEAKDGKKDGEKADGKDGAGSAAPSAAAVAAASRGRATKVLRAANPVRVARKTARSTSAWAKRPSGRLILPAVIAVLLLGAAGTAGAYLVPQALQSVPSPSVTPGFGQDAGASAGPVVAPSISGVPGLPGATTPPAVGGTLPATQPTFAGARPADVLATWAQQTGTRAGIPVVAVQAYGYAELVVARATPACHLNWTTIAAIAKVESSHGSHNGAVLNADGTVSPAILGLPLDGKGGRSLVPDTDHGTLDKDTQFDRAMGPLQFIPATWTAISVGNAVDADNNGFSDPNDIDDASLAAAKYLCQGGRDLSKPDAWWDAILSYNAVRPYAQKVFDAANEYGQRSRV
jgi:hypothetical protein